MIKRFLSTLEEKTITNMDQVYSLVIMLRDPETIRVELRKAMKFV